MRALQDILQAGNTPVVIGVNFQWVNPQSLRQQDRAKADLRAAIEHWRKDWVSQNTDAYLSHYTSDFFYSGGDLSKWASYKRQIQAAKPKVAVNLSEVSMFTYPNSTRNMVVVDFEQEFSSAALRNVMKKRQYWVQENGQWKILYEGSA
jgi:histidinol-phosphate/aromatic aminotransferase/cobyric acid decarboxylase-like protein